MEKKVSTDELKKSGIHTYEEILSKIQRRLKEQEIPPPTKRLRRGIAYTKNIYIKRLETVYNILVSEIDRIIDALKKTAGLQAFYKELFKIKTGYYPEQYISFFKNKKRILKRIYTEYLVPLKLTDNLLEARIKYRACLGRLLSVLKRHKKSLVLIKEVIRELSRMPNIEEDDLKIIIAGMPQVGKSTLVSKLSTAKPEIAPYPFTTKNIIVGHRVISSAKRIAFIDTPGLLDRPLEERNEIELKAILALKHFADKIVFLIDASPNAYYSIEEQIRVLNDVRRSINAPTIVCINKIDITPRDRIDQVREIISKSVQIDPKYILEISAYQGKGLDTLLDKIINDP